MVNEWLAGERAGVLLAGRNAIVSGIGPGMGRDVSLALAREGADLVLAARSDARLEEVAKDVRALGRRALCVRADVTRAEDCAALADTAVRELGGIDVLVNNAFHAGSFAPFETADLERWREPLEVNLFGTLRLTQAVLPALRARGGGSVVMIGSMIVRDLRPAEMADYAASKAALLAAAQGLARQLGRHRIRVNTVVPGYIWGESLEAWLRAQAKARGVAFEVVRDEVASQIALGHIPHSEEIAGAVVFFASDLSCAVTGQSLDVNGGHFLS
jgi:NAD(P)-dependent dehydrogenase (short-subunit alcohol dehydrogenase family)